MGSETRKHRFEPLRRSPWDQLEGAALPLASTLIELLDDKDDYVRKIAAQSVWDLYKKDRATIMALINKSNASETIRRFLDEPSFQSLGPDDN